MAKNEKTGTNKGNLQTADQAKTNPPSENYEDRQLFDIIAQKRMEKLAKEAEEKQKKANSR